MAELTLRVKAEYESAVACREELRKVEQAMKKLNENSSPQEIERLTKRYAELTAKWENSMSFIGKAGVYVKDAFNGIGSTIKQSVDVTKNLGTTTKTIEEAATKRLQLEENILSTLEAQKKTAEAQRNNAAAGLQRNKNALSYNEEMLKKKYNGQAEGFYDEADQKLLQRGREAVENWMKAWDDANVKVQVYDGLIEESTERQGKLTNAIEGTKNVYKGFADTVESSSHKIFLTEDVYNRYHQLSRTIEDLKRQITDIGQGDDIDIPKLNSLQDELAKNQTEFRALDEAARHTAEVLGSNLAGRVENSLKYLYEMNSAVRNSQKNYEELSASLKKAKQELAEAKTPAAITKAREEVDKLQDKLDSCSNTLSKFRAEQNDAIKDIENLSKKLDESGGDDEGNGIASLAGGLTEKIAAIAGIGLGLNELKDFFSQAKEWREYFQDIESSMKVFLGSAEKGAEFTAKLKDYAYYNMFEFSDLAAASQQMISYGHNVENIIPRLDQLSNVATGTHGSLMELVDTYNRAKATGVVDARGIQSWAVKGVMIRDVLRDMGEVTAGTTITFEQLNKVLDKITGEGGQFHNLMLEMMDNISAESGQLEDNLAAMYSEVGEKFEGVFVKWLKLQSAMAEGRNAFASDELLDFGAEKANQALDFLLQNWQKILSVIKDAVVVYGSYRAALITINAIEKAHAAWVAFKKAAIEGSTIATQKEALAKAAETAAEVSNTAATKANTIAKGQNASATMLVTHAFRQLAAAVAANPYTIAAAAVAALAYATYAAYDGILTQEKAQRLLNSASEDFNDKMKEQEQKDREYIGVIQDKTASLLEQTKAYRQLIAEREIFARFSKEEIAKMSAEQINSLTAEDTAKRNEEMVRNQVEAAKELQQIFAGKGAAWAHSQDEEIDSVVAKFKLLPEYAEELKNSIIWSTDLSDWADQLVSSSDKKLQEYLKNEAEAGVVEGFKKGFSNPEVQASTSKLMSDYSAAIEKQTSETEKQIAETQARIEKLRSGEEKTSSSAEKNSLINGLIGQIEALQKKLIEVRSEIGQTFNGTLSKQVTDAEKKVEELEHAVAEATGTKKVQLETELKDAKDDRDTLKSLMKLIEAGSLDAEIVMKITRDAENAQIGDEALVTIGEDYKKIDDIAQVVMSRIDEAKKKYGELADKSEESTKQMIEDFGLTADNIDSDFETATTKINGDISELESKIKDVKDDGERRKLQLEIDRKEQQLSYINTLKENLKDLCKDPFNINLDIKALIPDWLKQLLSKYAGINFDEEPKKDESQRAQEEGKTAQGNIDEKNKKGPTKQTGSQWERERRKNLRNELADINRQLKQPLEEKEYEELIKRKQQVESELKKGAKENKDILNRRQKDYDQFLKNREQQLAQERKAENAAENARIAGIENAAIREREERKNQFRIQEQQLEDQIEAYKKANVEQKKAEWSNKKENKDNIWADTAIAKEVKENGYKNIALTEAQEKEINEIRKKNKLEELRYYQDSYESLVKEHQSHIDQKIEIEKKYNNFAVSAAKTLADLRSQLNHAEMEDDRKRIQGEIDAVNRSIEQAEKDKQKELSRSEMSKLQESPLYSLAWEDLGSVSTETLKMLMDEFRKYEIQFKDSPEAMREWTDRIKAMSDEVVSRNPFKALIEARKELDDALEKKNKSKKNVENLRNAVNFYKNQKEWQEAQGMDTSETVKKLTENEKKLKDATKELGEAEKKEIQARNKLNKSWEDSKNQIDQLAGAISALGDSIDGEAGHVLKLIGNVMTFATSTADNIKKVAATGAEAISTMEKASVILTIISAAIQLAQQISELLPDTHGEYESYRDKINNTNRATKAVRDYEMAVMDAQLAEKSWFATSGMKGLENQWKKSGQARDEYFKKLYEAQAIYENESGSGWLTKLGAQANKTIASIFGEDSALTKAVQFGWANAAGGYIGMNMWLENELYNKGYDNKYIEGTTAAIRNLRIETREASKGFLGTGVGGHNQETEDLVTYLKRETGLDLFNEDGWLNEEAYQAVMENYGDKLVGETEETLEQLKELKDKHDEFLEQLHDYVDNLYSPIVEDFVDAMWEWYDQGTDALRAFRKSAGDTFRNIMSDFLKTQMLDRFAQKMGDDITKAYEAYFDKGEITYDELMSRVTDATNMAMQEFSEMQPVLQQTMLAMEEALGSMGISMKANASEQSASVQAMQRITVDQAEELVGRMNAGQIIWQQQKDELSLLNATSETLMMAVAGTGGLRDIADDSRDILAGMAIHVEEIRDGVVDTIVPKIRSIDDNLYRVKNIVEKQY